MTNQIDTFIKEIAVNHGLALERDDPILIMQTLNTKLMEDSAIAQQTMLNQYKVEMEEIALRWANDTKDKSERILNASLAASKEAMANLLQESASTTAKTIQNKVDESLARVNNALLHAQRTATINLTASCVTFMAVCLIIIGVFFR